VAAAGIGGGENLTAAAPGSGLVAKARKENVDLSGAFKGFAPTSTCEAAVTALSDSTAIFCVSTAVFCASAGAAEAAGIEIAAVCD
jgi:hypothetical protein